MSRRRVAKRAAVAVAGSALLLAGAVLLVLPGPGLGVMAVGLALLASEFPWAGRLLHRSLARINGLRARAASRRRRSR